MPQHLPWAEAVDRITFDFQPIVNGHTGACYGYEALLRGWKSAGFDSIQDVFDTASDELTLHRVDLALREKAVGSFCALPNHDSARLFFNTDSRVLETPDYRPGLTRELLRDHGLSTDTMCLEVSERHDLSRAAGVLSVLQSYRAQGFGIALDDFGTGYSGLQLLYNCHPDLIKIDRFFIEGISTDPRKRVFVANVVAMARALGITVIAEGVETAEEMRVCRDAGCDLLQGFFIQRPTDDPALLTSFYAVVHEESGRRADPESPSASALSHRIVRSEPLPSGASMSDALTRFREDARSTFLVIVNSRQEPVGVLREESIKPFVFSPFGWALLACREDEVLDAYVSSCPVGDINSSFEQFIDLFSCARGSEEGIIVTDRGRYVGFIPASEIVRGMSERDVATAREQNPLTRLPGNNRIAEYLREALADRRASYCFVYYDFDDFKAFNDTYGFHRGDQAIQMFAERLRMASQERPMFLGHVGGDDFFAGTRVRRGDCDWFVSEVSALMTEFRESVRSLYSAEDRERGGVVAYDRTGEEHFFPLLGVSAAVVYAPEGGDRMTLNELGPLIAALKKSSKTSPTHVMTCVCGEPLSGDWPDDSGTVDLSVDHAMVEEPAISDR
jgi:EAL domain-containing protein (putative c-di-GMP-specific phosphodiesterase class I)/GGDEF domain-containing protein